MTPEAMGEQGVTGGSRRTATRREMVPDSFQFPLRVAFAFNQCAQAESEDSPLDPIAASLSVRRALRHPLPHLNDSPESLQ